MDTLRLTLCAALFSLIFSTMPNKATATSTMTETPVENAPTISELSPDTFSIDAPPPLKIIPHDKTHFTQGLVYHNDFLYESAGQYGQSSLSKIHAETGEIVQKVTVPPEYFAEGLALVDDTLVQLSWKRQTAFLYDLDTLERIGEKHYPTEGWGLAYQAPYLYLSDGTPYIYKINYSDFKIAESFMPNYYGQPFRWINELEFVGEYLWANIWQTNSILVIDPVSANVVHQLNFDLPMENDRHPNDDVLNGIAYDTETGRLYITGKYFSKIYLYNISQFQ